MAIAQAESLALICLGDGLITEDSHAVAGWVKFVTQGLSMKPWQFSFYENCPISKLITICIAAVELLQTGMANE
jgi:hypothetical protein